MSSSNDRPIGVLDRSVDRQPASRPEPRRATPLPRGWGSHEERRLMRWGLAFFLFLGLYAAVFVILGQVVWS